MGTILLLIQQYGYIIVFLFTLIEGETVVALAGFTAYQGYLNIVIVVIVAIVGAIIGDQAYFCFGRYKGRRFLERRPKLAARAKRIHLVIERHQNLLMFGSRFMYGFRTIIPIAIGTTKVKWSKFVIFNMIGSVIWATFFALGGYAFGNALERFIGHIRKAEKFIIIGVLVGACIVQGVLFIRKRVADELEEEERRLSKEDHHEKIH